MSVNITKWNPVNWFKHEQNEANSNKQGKGQSFLPAINDDPLFGIHREIDRVFDNMFSRFGMGSILNSPSNEKISTKVFSNMLLKPNVDIKERKKDYKITVEVPGVEENDIKLELTGDALTISGEKKYEKEESDEHYHSIERSYGSFRRILSLPDDADKDNIDAKFKNGVLTITIARKAIEKPEGNVKQIEIKNAA